VSRVVHSSRYEAVARLACDLLAAHGIPAEMRGASLVALRGALPIEETTVTVEVLHDDDVDRARALLGELDDAAGEAWQCMRCAEENPASFEVCWKCGASDRAWVGSAASPYRGKLDGPAAVEPAQTPAVGEPAAAPAPTAVASAPPSDLGVLLWAIGAGCLPIAFTVRAFHVDPDLSAGLGSAGRAGLINLVAGIQAVACLGILSLRGVPLRERWGGRERWIADTVAMVVFGWLLDLAHDRVYHLLLAPAGARVRLRWPAAPTLEWVLLVAGTCLVAAAGSLLYYSVVLKSARALLRSRLAAVLVTALLAALTWSAGRGTAAFGAELAVQLLLCGAFLLGGRAWPIAIAAAVSVLLPSVIHRL
jgi:hypothetical protein